jgi:E1-E2 ATPase
MVQESRFAGLLSFFGFFANPLVIILVIASSVSLALGENVGGLIIIAIVLFSVLLNFLMEFQARHAAEDIQKQIAITAAVVRDGREQQRPTVELVPGDIIRLNAGDLVPADARLLEVKDLHVRESVLTGESLPVEKTATDLAKEKHGVADASNSVKNGRLIMNFSEITTTQIATVVGVILLIAVGIAVLYSIRKRKTERLRTQFGGAEYSRVVEQSDSRRKAEAVLDGRAERVERLHIRPLAAGDRARFVDSWARVQNRFVDGPGSAVTDADQLLGDVMSTRGYPVSDFEQRVADISADHPLVLDNYRAAHHAAVRQAQGQASTEELRKAMIHYRTLFEELVNEPETASAKSAT